MEVHLGVWKELRSSFLGAWKEELGSKSLAGGGEKERGGEKEGERKSHLPPLVAEVDVLEAGPGVDSSGEADRALLLLAQWCPRVAQQLDRSNL